MFEATTEAVEVGEFAARLGDNVEQLNATHVERYLSSNFGVIDISPRFFDFGRVSRRQSVLHPSGVFMGAKLVASSQ